MKKLFIVKRTIIETFEGVKAETVLKAGTDVYWRQPTTKKVVEQTIMEVPNYWKGVKR